MVIDKSTITTDIYVFRYTCNNVRHHMMHAVISTYGYIDPCLPNFRDFVNALVKSIFCPHCQ